MPRHFAWLLAIAACDGTPAATDAPQLDAAPDGAPDAFVDPRLPCLGTPAPMTAPDPLVLTGKLFAIDHYQVAPLAGGTVTLRPHGGGAPLAQATTAADGTFTLQVATEGYALAAEFTAAAAGYRPTLADPGDRLHGNETPLLIVAKDDELARWYTDAGASYTPGDRTLITATIGCAVDAIGGTTITSVPAAPVTYYNDPAKHWDPALAASTNGFALFPHAPQRLGVTAHLDTLGFPMATVAVPDGTVELALITPHKR